MKRERESDVREIGVPEVERVAGYWDRQTLATDPAAMLSAYGTVTRDADAVALRDRLERAHLSRVLRLHGGSRVLDLGGGAGRLALFVAPRVAEVVLVDVSQELLEVAEREARERGLDNVRTIRASALEFDYAHEGPFDAIFVFGLCAHLRDSEVGRLTRALPRALAPGGRLYLKEPVTTDGTLRIDEQREHGDGYRVLFRPRGFYAETFGRTLRHSYQRPTCAHILPFFAGSTERAVAATRSPLRRVALSAAAPLLVRTDPVLQRVENALRGRAWSAKLLAPVPVLQDLYIFEAPPAPDAQSAHAAPGEPPELSVVVIAYNEARCLSAVVRELSAAVRNAGVAFELVLVDDGSEDATLAQMREFERRHDNARVVALAQNGGIGAALRAGFDAARGHHVTWVPADGQIGPETVLALHAARARAPMLTTVYSGRADGALRNGLSRSLNALIQLRTGTPAKSGGNYLFERHLWQNHGPRDDDTMMISTGFRHRLRAAGIPIEELSITPRRRFAGRSKVLNLRTIARTGRALLRL